MEVTVLENATTEDIELAASEMYARQLYIDKIIKKGNYTFLYFSTQAKE
jgi:hypothetical protein